MNIGNILSAIQQGTNVNPKPFKSTKPQTLPSISYTLYRQKDDAIVESWRFQIRITANTLKQCLSLEDSIAEALCSLGDEQKHGTLKIELNGGGTLEDPDTGFPQILAFYDIQDRS